MFTGIIEAFAKVHRLTKEGANLHLQFECELANELKIDQSVAHNGVCLTVVACDDQFYTVTAIQETLEKTNLGLLHDLVQYVRPIDRLASWPAPH